MTREKLKYHYNGPLYRFERTFRAEWEGYTEAVSEKQAINNLNKKAKDAFGFLPSAKLTIDPKYLEVIPVEDEDETFRDVEPIKTTCDKCGATLTDAGECPSCDLGDNSVFEESCLKEEFERISKDEEAWLDQRILDNNFEIVSKRDYGHYGENFDGLYDVHYQIISKEGNKTREDYEEAIDWIDNLLDEFEDFTGSPCTFNIGLQTDGYISCGFDCRAVFYKPGEDVVHTKPTTLKFRDGKPADDATKATLKNLGTRFGIDDITPFIPLDSKKKDESLDYDRDLIKSVKDGVSKIWTKDERLKQAKEKEDRNKIRELARKDFKKNNLLAEDDYAAFEYECNKLGLQATRELFDVYLNSAVDLVILGYTTNEGLKESLADAPQQVEIEVEQLNPDILDQYGYDEAILHYLYLVYGSMPLSIDWEWHDKDIIYANNIIWDKKDWDDFEEDDSEENEEDEDYIPTTGYESKEEALLIEIANELGMPYDAKEEGSGDSWNYISFLHDFNNGRGDEWIDTLEEEGLSEDLLDRYKELVSHSDDELLEEGIVIKPGSTTIEQKYKEFDTKQEAIDYIIAENGYGEMFVRYIPKTNKYRVVWEEIAEPSEESNSELEEDIEKHDQLNPKLFDEGNKLKPEVREKIFEIVKEFTDGLIQDNIKFDISDIILVGSNCSYNYTKDSDLDVHIRMKTNSLDCPDNLYPLLYSAYRSMWNSKMDIDFYNIPVELYVETEDSTAKSNGIYSVMKDEWIKEPVQQDIPDLDEEAFDKLFSEWEDKYFDLIEK